MTMLYLNPCCNTFLYKGTTVHYTFSISETVVFFASEIDVKVMAYLHSSHIENQKEILSTVMLRKYIWALSPPPPPKTKQKQQQLSLGFLT